jgi:hypothetical protein
VDNTEWSLTAIYGPQSENEKLSFMQEIRELKQEVEERWPLLDFNFIYRASDKSSGRINRKLMNSFRVLLDEIEMKKLHLHGPKYTWSSGTHTPILLKIDHVFTSREWELMYPSYHLQAGSTSVYDHCPMVLTCAPFQKRYKGFRFESCCLLSLEFKDIVAQSWMLPVNSVNKSRVLHIKLARLAKALKKWHKEKVIESKWETATVQQVVLQFDQVQDEHPLTEEEHQLRKEAQHKILALAAVR